MPIKIPDNLPSKEVLRKENIFIMDESRAFNQDIRPLRILILNLMPNKQVTEVQLLRRLGNSPLQIDVSFLYMETHTAKNTSLEYLMNFYEVFDDIRHLKFDGMIITGAPVETLPFEAVTYWDELKSVFEWTKTNVTSTLYICWGAQAGLYYHYGIPKYPLKKKMHGVFTHTHVGNSELLRGFDDIFNVPHSRHTEVRAEDVRKCGELEILSESEASGVYIVMSQSGKHVFVTGHSEYDVNTLKDEYERDIKKGDKVSIPQNYFKDDDPSKPPVESWRAHSTLLFTNWLNLVYQQTPYDLDGE